MMHQSPARITAQCLGPAITGPVHDWLADAPQSCVLLASACHLGNICCDSRMQNNDDEVTMGTLSRTQAYAQAVAALDVIAVRHRLGDLSIIDDAIFETATAWHYPCTGKAWVVSMPDMPYGPLSGDITVTIPKNRAATTFDISPPNSWIDRSAPARRGQKTQVRVCSSAE